MNFFERIFSKFNGIVALNDNLIINKRKNLIYYLYYKTHSEILYENAANLNDKIPKDLEYLEWRLPTKNELLNLKKRTKYSNLFENASMLWSSTIYESSLSRTPRVLVVDFDSKKTDITFVSIENTTVQFNALYVAEYVNNGLQVKQKDEYF